MLRDELQTLIQRIPPETWHAQRWFGGKDRRIEGIALRDFAQLPDDNSQAFLTLIDISYADAPTETYFLPMASGGCQPPGNSNSQQDTVQLDGLSDPDLCRKMLRAFADNARLQACHGRFIFQATPALLSTLKSQTTDAVTVLPPHQSNSLVNFADVALLKCLRRPAPGINPDVEVAGFLTTQTKFQNIARLLGTLTYVDGDTQWSLAILQTFIPNQGNAWSLWQDILRETLASGGCKPPDNRSSLRARRLGERTGELHVALASRDEVPDFAPEQIDKNVAQLTAAARTEEIHRALATLRDRRHTLPADLQEYCAAVLAGEDRLVAAASGDVAHGWNRIRIHGDYHLGQVLVKDDDFVIIDFEGEPMRTLEDRRAKHCALRDVAGMLRSFNYAGFAALFDTAGVPGIDPQLRAQRRQEWEAETRAAYLEGYFSAARASRAPLFPADRQERENMLRGYELEKAMYELRYELANRPDWVRIPLSGILHYIARGLPFVGPQK